MSPVWTVALVALSAFVVDSSQPNLDCSYMGLTKHLKLTSSNDDLSIIRPVVDWHHATNVSVDMLIYGILGVDEMSQTVTTHVWILVGWTNEILTWNVSEFCGIRSLTVPRTMIWNPDLYMLEDSSDSGTLVKGPMVILDYTGEAASFISGKLITVCSLNLRLYPFDIQYCNITFMSLTMDANELRLGLQKEDVIKKQLSSKVLITKGEWELIEMDVLLTTEEGLMNKSQLAYRMTLKRKPMLHIINFIVPLFYLLILDLASFFISHSSGEKLSFKVTVLLSISVLLLILQDMLPSTEDQLPLIASYCIGIFALVGVSLLECMLMCFLCSMDEWCPKKTQKGGNSDQDVHTDEPAVVSEQVDMKMRKQARPSDHDLLAMILQEVKAAEQEVVHTEKTLGFYAKVARVIDVIFFTLYLLAVIIFFVAFYFSWVPTGFFD
ncbi:5-hydroxytryptamine receptor 3A-like [Neosynchiropus ocellatus]